jgi:SAM-dependent methyltransferase
MYQQIARYYDLLHSQLTADIEFVADLAQEATGPVLELGCGTARLLLPLARLGHEAIGVDASEAMLAIARAKLADEGAAVRTRVSLHQGDISQVDLDGRFGLVVIAYNTLMHLAPVALASCLANVRRRLAPGAALFIDVDNPAAVHDPGQDGLLLLERTVYDEERGEIVVLSVSSVGDGEQQTRETIWLVDVSPAGGGPLKRIVATSTLHYYFAHQLGRQLETAGFALLGQYGDYDKQPYDADESERLLLLAMAR